MAHQLKRAILVATTVCGALPLQAQFHANEDSYLSAFYDMCLTTTYHPDLLNEAGRDFQWERVPDELLERIRPDYWNATMQGWVVDRPDIATPFMMVGGVEPADGTFLCMMFFLYADGRYMLDVLMADTNAAMLEATTLPGATATTILVGDPPDTRVDLIFYYPPAYLDGVMLVAVLAD